VTEPFDDDEFETGGSTDGAGDAASLLPRENPILVGQEMAEATLLQSYNSGRLAHAWLLTGPRGIGKATLAFRFARFLFARAAEAPGLFGAPPLSLAVDPSHPAFRRVAAGGHADLVVVERGYDPKRKRRRGEIVVEDVRALIDFLHLTPAEGGWRIVIVDGADEMNRNAANALLKILEEPSQHALLLITATSAGRLPPTIRSRCRPLRLGLLSETQIADLLRKSGVSLAPDAMRAVVRLAEGSIGRALDLAGANTANLYGDLNTLLSSLPAYDIETLHRFADRCARSDGEDSFRLVAELLPGWIARMVARAAGTDGIGAVIAGEGDAMARLASRRGLDRWVEVWEKLNRLFALADGVNLDRKQVVLSAFFELEQASR